MYIIKKPKKINLNVYKKFSNVRNNFYGLPKQVIYCNTCSFTNQKPNSEKEYKHNINKNP